MVCDMPWPIRKSAETQGSESTLCGHLADLAPPACIIDGPGIVVKV